MPSRRVSMNADHLVKGIRRRYGLGRRGAATIYVLHFTTPVEHARHYVGFTGGNVDERITAHRERRGGALMRELMRRGGDFVLSLSFTLSLNAARTVERKLKNLGSGVRLCPICAREAQDIRNAAARERRAARKAAGNDDETDLRDRHEADRNPRERRQVRSDDRPSSDESDRPSIELLRQRRADTVRCPASLRSGESGVAPSVG